MRCFPRISLYLHDLLSLLGLYDGLLPPSQYDWFHFRCCLIPPIAGTSIENCCLCRWKTHQFISYNHIKSKDKHTPPLYRPRVVVYAWIQDWIRFRIYFQFHFSTYLLFLFIESKTYFFPIKSFFLNFFLIHSHTHNIRPDEYILIFPNVNIFVLFYFIYLFSFFFSGMFMYIFFHF